MSTTTTLKNGEPRKSLAGQLDRLDSILDALSIGLNEAVASAVQEAAGVVIQEAVRAAVVEVLSNADLLARLRPATVTHDPVPAPSANSQGDSLWGKLKNLAQAAWGQTCRLVRGACGVAVAVAQAACSSARSLASTAGKKLIEVTRISWMWTMVLANLAKRFRMPLVIALGVGVVIGVGCYCAGPVVSSLVNGVAGFTAALVAAAVTAVRRALAAGDLHVT